MVKLIDIRLQRFVRSCDAHGQLRPHIMGPFNVQTPLIWTVGLLVFSITTLLSAIRLPLWLAVIKWQCQVLVTSRGLDRRAWGAFLIRTYFHSS